MDSKGDIVAVNEDTFLQTSQMKNKVPSSTGTLFTRIAIKESSDDNVKANIPGPKVRMTLDDIALQATSMSPPRNRNREEKKSSSRHQSSSRHHSPSRHQSSSRNHKSRNRNRNGRSHKGCNRSSRRQDESSEDSHSSSSSSRYSSSKPSSTSGSSSSSSSSGSSVSTRTTHTQGGTPLDEVQFTDQHPNPIPQPERRGFTAGCKSKFCVCGIFSPFIGVTIELSFTLHFSALFLHITRVWQR